MTDSVLRGARATFLMSALLYPLAVVLIIALAVRDDPFNMFQIKYWVLSFGALPLVWAFVTILAARRFGALPLGWLVVFLAALGLVTFGHFWVMVQFAGGV